MVRLDDDCTDSWTMIVVRMDDDRERLDDYRDTVRR